MHYGISQKKEIRALSRLSGDTKDEIWKMGLMDYLIEFEVAKQELKERKDATKKEPNTKKTPF